MTDVLDSREAPLAVGFREKPASRHRLAGKRVGMVVFSPYPADPRPRRAAEALIREGMEVDYLCEGDGKLPRKECVNGLNVTRIPIRHWRGGAASYVYQYSIFILWTAVILGWRMIRRRYDLIYVHNMPDILVISGLFPKMLGAKMVLDQHDPMPELMMTIFGKDESSLPVRIIRHLEKWSIARVDKVITVNKACVKIFSARSCNEKKISVIMNCPDADIFPYRAASSYPLRALDAPFVMMYHGSLVERNGLELAVDALVYVIEHVPNVELRVFGKTTPYLERVLEKAKQLGVEKYIRYLGARKLEDLAREIEQCDIGIIPNERNRFTDINTPTRIFEYLALGKPAIAPSTPGIQDYFDPGSLFFFESGDSAELAKVMVHVASHPDEARTLAREGQQVYLKHDWQSERETLVSVVESLVGSGHSVEHPGGM